MIHVDVSELAALRLLHYGNTFGRGAGRGSMSVS